MPCARNRPGPVAGTAWDAGRRGSAPIRLPPPEVHGRQGSATARAMAVEGMEQEPVPTAIPEVALLHGPEGGEAVFGVLVVAVLDGNTLIGYAVIGEGVGNIQWDDVVAQRVSPPQEFILIPSILAMRISKECIHWHGSGPGGLWSRQTAMRASGRKRRRLARWRRPMLPRPAMR